MMSFKNIRLPINIEVGATGGAQFKTTIVETVAGFEFRNVEWSKRRGRWTVGYTDVATDIHKVTEFFHAVRGRACGFRFRDWADYKVDNPIADGDGEILEFQAIKAYRVDDEFFNRVLTRLDEVEIITLDLNDEPIALTYEVDKNTGKITFTAPPPIGSQIWLKGTFDVPVRFDNDELPITMISQTYAKIDGLDLVELRE